MLFIPVVLFSNIFRPKFCDSTAAVRIIARRRVRRYCVPYPRVTPPRGLRIIYRQPTAFLLFVLMFSERQSTHTFRPMFDAPAGITQEEGQQTVFILLRCLLSTAKFSARRVQQSLPSLPRIACVLATLLLSLLRNCELFFHSGEHFKPCELIARRLSRMATRYTISHLCCSTALQL